MDQFEQAFRTLPDTVIITDAYWYIIDFNRESPFGHLKKGRNLTNYMPDCKAQPRDRYACGGQVFKRAIRQWEPEINAYIADKLSFLIEALPSFEFILKINQITDRMKQAGLKLTEPVYCEKSERVFEADGLYNPILAMFP